MGSAFLEPPANYHVPDALETPYLRARQEWDERMGGALVHAKNWRLAFFGALLISIISLTGFALLSMKPRMIPVIVTTDNLSGKTDVIGDIRHLAFEPGEIQIKYFLSQFIARVRSVPSDPVVIKKNWTEAYAFLRREAANKLNALANSEDGSALFSIGEQMVTATPISIVRVGESESYQARWKEEVFDKNGLPTESYNMVGIFEIEIESPERDDILLINPLGVFISNFQWNREL